MSFSETYIHSGSIEISPNSKHVASSRGANLNIYSSKSFELLSNWSLPDVPSQILWSPTSETILTVHPKKHLVHIFSINQHDWNGKISMYPNGISGAVSYTHLTLPTILLV